MSTVTWVLILFAHVSVLGGTDSNSLASVPGFASEQECTEAGNEAKVMAKSTTKVIKFACVKQTTSRPRSSN